MTNALLPIQAAHDEQMIALWLHGRSERTQRAYQADIARFLACVGKPLPLVTLGDLQAFADSLDHLAPNSRKRTLSAVKSLLSKAQKIGYLQFNVGAALELSSTKNTLGERILSEEQVQRMLALETNARNHALLRLLYAAGLRCSELCGLRWRDVQPKGYEAVLQVYGKGGKTRYVLISRGTFDELRRLAGQEPHPDAPVFVSKRGGALDASQVHRIVKAAAKRAGLPGDVSPHWLRHAHASHALDRGAPISLVQATLGHASVQTTGKYLHARPNESSGRYLSV